MQLKVLGENPNITSSEVKYAAEWMSALIMSTQLRKNLKITVSFKREKGVLGTTEVRDYDDENFRLPRKFLLRIDPKERRNSILKILAHELVHVKQFARGEMIDTGHPNYIKWNKQPVNQDKINYWDLPWEIEAFGREYGMFRRYNEHVKNDKIRFV